MEQETTYSRLFKIGLQAGRIIPSIIVLILSIMQLSCDGNNKDKDGGVVGSEGGAGAAAEGDVGVGGSQYLDAAETDAKVDTMQGIDSGSQKSGAQDTGNQDTGSQESGVWDTGNQDTGSQESGVQDTGNQDTGADAATAASVQAVSQTLDDVTTRVIVAEARLMAPGWVVIHEDDGGQPGTAIGYAAASGGENSDIAVILIRPALDGERLYAMLHQDLGTQGNFEFPGADAPVVDNQGDAVATAFDVTVVQGTPAVRLTLSNVGSSSYDFVSAEPDRYGSDLGVGAQDPTITLLLHWRYEIVNQASTFHPFELIAAGATPATDSVVLSQSIQGSMENDAAVDWFDDGDSTIGFTITEALSNTINGYRCAVHITNMRGAIEFE